MENHHVQWVNPLFFMVILNSYFDITRGYVTFHGVPHCSGIFQLIFHDFPLLFPSLSASFPMMFPSIFFHPTWSDCGQIEVHNSMEKYQHVWCWSQPPETCQTLGDVPNLSRPRWAPMSLRTQETLANMPTHRSASGCFYAEEILEKTGFGYHWLSKNIQK